MFHNDTKDKEFEVPDCLLCPVTSQILLHPVTLIPSGIVIEQQAADKIISKNHNQPLCPISRKKIKGYFSAYKVEEIIDEFIKKHPEAKKQQYTPVEPFKKCSEKWISDDKPVASLPTNETKPSLNIAFPMHNTERDIPSAVPLGLDFDSDLFDYSIPRTPPRQRAATPSIDEDPDLFDYPTSSMPPRRHAITPPRLPSPKMKFLYDLEKATLRKDLLNDLENLIWALRFEVGPQPERSNHFIHLAFNARAAPLPWQKIQITNGPKNDSMHIVLRAAIESLKKLDPSILKNCKQTFANYDEVQPVFGKARSLSTSIYAKFPKSMGRIANQPGHLVSRILQKVESNFPTLCPTGTTMRRS